MKTYFPDNPYERHKAAVDTASEALFIRTGEWADKWTGWIDHPQTYPHAEEYEKVKETAEYIRKKFDVVLSCGIGGSYLGARAVIEAVYGDYNGSPRRTGPEIYFIGQNTSSEVIADVVERCADKKVCIINISKSGKTLETALSFRTFYHECNPDVVAVTGTDGILREMTEKHSWESFVVPEDIGGRYSVFTAVGLLPIAIAGIDTDLLLKGAAKAVRTSEGVKIAKEYAAYRFDNFLRPVEFFAVNSPWLTQLLEWHKQLFAESHGKIRLGTFPSGGTYPMDLHSVGQFIQDGTPLFFETQLIRTNQYPVKIPSMPTFGDGLEEYVALDFDLVNRAQMDGTKAAHEGAGMKVAQFELESDAPLEELGQFMQTDMLACPIEAYIIGVNPFDQPGVEAHKKMTAKLLKEMITNS